MFTRHDNTRRRGPGRAALTALTLVALLPSMLWSQQAKFDIRQHRLKLKSELNAITRAYRDSLGSLPKTCWTVKGGKRVLDMTNPITRQHVDSWWKSMGSTHAKFARTDLRAGKLNQIIAKTGAAKNIAHTGRVPKHPTSDIDLTAFNDDAAAKLVKEFEAAGYKVVNKGHYLKVENMDCVIWSPPKNVKFGSPEWKSWMKSRIADPEVYTTKGGLFKVSKGKIGAYDPMGFAMDECKKMAASVKMKTTGGIDHMASDWKTISKNVLKVAQETGVWDKMSETMKKRLLAFREGKSISEVFGADKAGKVGKRDLQRFYRKCKDAMGKAVRAASAESRNMQKVYKEIIDLHVQMNRPDLAREVQKKMMQARETTNLTRTELSKTVGKKDPGFQKMLDDVGNLPTEVTNAPGPTMTERFQNFLKNNRFSNFLKGKFTNAKTMLDNNFWQPGKQKLWDPIKQRFVDPAANKMGRFKNALSTRLDDAMNKYMWMQRSRDGIKAAMKWNQKTGEVFNRWGQAFANKFPQLTWGAKFAQKIGRVGFKVGWIGSSFASGYEAAMEESIQKMQFPSYWTMFRTTASELTMVGPMKGMMQHAYGRTNHWLNHYDLKYGKATWSAEFMARFNALGDMGSMMLDPARMAAIEAGQTAQGPNGSFSTLGYWHHYGARVVGEYTGFSRILGAYYRDWPAEARQRVQQVHMYNFLMNKAQGATQNLNSLLMMMENLRQNFDQSNPLVQAKMRQYKELYDKEMAALRKYAKVMRKRLFGPLSPEQLDPKNPDAHLNPIHQILKQFQNIKKNGFVLVVENQKSWYCTNRPNIEVIMKIVQHVRRKNVPTADLEKYQKTIYKMLADAHRKGVNITPVAKYREQVAKSIGAAPNLSDRQKRQRMVAAEAELLHALTIQDPKRQAAKFRSIADGRQSLSPDAADAARRFAQSLHPLPHPRRLPPKKAMAVR